MDLLYALPGARPDFLMSIIDGTIVKQSLTSTSITTLEPSDNVIKAHPLKTNGDIELLFNSITTENLINVENFPAFLKENKLYSVRIKATTDQDIVNIAYLDNYKNSRQYTLEASSWIDNPEIKIIFTATMLENIDKDILDQYNLTINFSDLWNVDKISEIYTQVTGNTLTSEQLEAIANNIAIQPVLPYPYTA